jgi:hypothetical protein
MIELSCECDLLHNLTRCPISQLEYDGKRMHLLPLRLLETS